MSRRPARDRCPPLDGLPRSGPSWAGFPARCLGLLCSALESQRASPRGGGHGVTVSSGLWARKSGAVNHEHKPEVWQSGEPWGPLAEGARAQRLPWREPRLAPRWPWNPSPPAMQSSSRTEGGRGGNDVPAYELTVSFINCGNGWRWQTQCQDPRAGAAGSCLGKGRGC